MRKTKFFQKDGILEITNEIQKIENSTRSFVAQSRFAFQFVLTYGVKSRYFILTIYGYLIHRTNFIKDCTTLFLSNHVSDSEIRENNHGNDLRFRPKKEYSENLNISIELIKKLIFLLIFGYEFQSKNDVKFLTPKT
uniref:Uncharacterized protein n=1 Tax=Romanomermis culicivorax TaxID=13658 RepID=A0A915I5G5_ROMCU